MSIEFLAARLDCRLCENSLDCRACLQEEKLSRREIRVVAVQEFKFCSNINLLGLYLKERALEDSTGVARARCSRRYGAPATKILLRANLICDLSGLDRQVSLLVGHQRCSIANPHHSTIAHVVTCSFPRIAVVSIVNHHNRSWRPIAFCSRKLQTPFSAAPHLRASRHTSANTFRASTTSLHCLQVLFFDKTSNSYPQLENPGLEACRKRPEATPQNHPPSLRTRPANAIVVSLYWRSPS